MLTKTFFSTLALSAALALPALAQTTTPAAPAEEMTPAEGMTPAAPAEGATPPAEGTAPPAMTEPDMAAAYLSARNQLGLLTYCKDEGHIGDEAIAVQQKMLGMIPEGDVTAGDAAEELGTTGTVSAMGQEMTLADGAASQSTTEEAMCQQIETMLKQVGEQMSKG